MCYNSKLRGNFPHECTKRRWQQEKTLQDIEGVSGECELWSETKLNTHRHTHTLQAG